MRSRRARRRGCLRRSRASLQPAVGPCQHGAASDAALLLDVDVRAREAFVEALERLIVADDVELVTPETRVALVGVEGPDAERLVGRPLAPYAHAETDVTGIAVRAVRASEVRGSGVVFHVAAERA